MAVGSASTSRAGTFAVLALLVPVAALVVAGDASAGGAAARAHRHVVVRITSASVRGLYPGARRRLRLILANTNGHRAVAVRRIRVRSISTSRPSCTPTARNLTIRQYASGPLVLRAGARRAVLVTLKMPQSVSNGCQRAVFRLRYSAQTSLRRRRR